MQPFLQHCWTHLLQHNVEHSDTTTQEVMFSHLLYNLHIQLRRKDSNKLVLWRRVLCINCGACLGNACQGLLHTHLIKHSGSSVVKQAASVPTEISLLVILICVSDLNVPEVFWNVCLDFPATRQKLSGSHIADASVNAVALEDTGLTQPNSTWHCIHVFCNEGSNAVHMVQVT